MPITDNKFTGDELTAALQANPELATIVQGTVLNHEAIRDAIQKDAIDAKKKEWAERDEAETFALTGVQKKEKEAFYDYRKRAFTEKLSEQQKELDLLKDKTNPSAADKARIDQLEKTLQDKDAEFNTKISAKDKEIADFRINVTLETAAANLRAKFKAGLPQDLVDIAVQNAIREAAAEAQVQQDNVVTFIDKDGKPRLSTSTYKPLTAVDILSEKLKTIIDDGKKQEGAGSKEGGDGGTDPNSKWTGLPVEVTTQVQLTQHLLKLGIMQGTKEYDKIWAENAPNLKLR